MIAGNFNDSKDLEGLSRTEYHAKLTKAFYENVMEAYGKSSVQITPYAPSKFLSKDFSFNIKVYINKRWKRACGFSLQLDENRNPLYKMWFYDHPEWERETKYPVTRFADNGTGEGSGAGFYLDTENDCIQESKQFLNAKYDLSEYCI